MELFLKFQQHLGPLLSSSSVIPESLTQVQSFEFYEGKTIADENNELLEKIASYRYNSQKTFV